MHRGFTHLEIRVLTSLLAIVAILTLVYQYRQPTPTIAPPLESVGRPLIPGRINTMEPGSTPVTATPMIPPTAVPTTPRPSPAPSPTKTAAPTPSPIEKPPSEGWMPDGRLDLNRATQRALEHLPGIGPNKAAVIIADRTANGPFPTVAHLDRVKGFGEKTVAALAPHLFVATIEGAPPPPPPQPAKKEKATQEDPVRINLADAEELQRLNGVGPKTAERILAHRNRYGPFRGMNDLLKVNGIGKAFLEANSGIIRFN